MELGHSRVQPSAPSPVTGLKAMSDRFAAWFDWTTPNLVTAFGITLVPVIFSGFLGWRVSHIGSLLAVGIAAYIVAALSDWLDGALSTRQFEQDGGVEKTREQLAAEAALPLARQLLLRGRTTLGKKTDPMRDKGMFYSVLLTLGIGFLPTALIVANVSLALLLTAIRWQWVMERFGFTDAAANAYGKRKMHLEVVTVACLVLLIPWPTACWALSSLALLGATVLALLSFLGHCRNRRAPAGSRF